MREITKISSRDNAKLAMARKVRDGKIEAARILEATAGARHLDGEASLAWLRCLNDVRVMIGTDLNISEDADIEVFLADPATERNAIIYVALTELVDLLVRAVDPT